MFGLGDDFDIDESFLDEVLEVEKASVRNIGQLAQGSSVNISNDSLVRGSSSDTGPGPQISSDLLSRQTPPSLRNVVRESRPVVAVLPRESGRARKFPGPAGLLPQRQGNSSLIATDDFLNELEDELRAEAPHNEEVLSQESTQRLESPAWAELMKDLGANGKTLLRRLNVASVSSRAKQTRALKVPFLALLIQAVDTSAPDPCLYLSDTSGEMVGAVHREVWERLGEDLVVGTVIVLLNVGVLCAGNSSTRHYLNITTNNIASLYSPTKGNDIRVTNMKPLAEPDCLKFLQSWQKLLTSPTPQPCHQTHQTDRQLFSTASFSPLPNPNVGRPSFSNKSLSSTNRSFNMLPSSPGEILSPLSCNSPSYARTSTNFSTPCKPLNHHDPLTPGLALKPACSKREVGPFGSFQARQSSDIITFKNNAFNNAPSSSKRPRSNQVEVTSQKTTSQDAASQSVVETLLCGIDTDSLFSDF